MELFAIYTIFKSIDHLMDKRLKDVIATSMVAGSLISLIYFNFVVLNVSPWFELRYIIQIAGMMIGNAMTDVKIGEQSLLYNIIDNSEKIENTLMIGVVIKKTVKNYDTYAIDSTTELT